MQIVCRRTVGVAHCLCALCSMLSHRAGKFKSSVILCDMKQVCELSEDAARRVMSSTCSVSTSRSLAGLGRSSGQCGHPSLHSRTRTPFEPEHRSTQQGTATQSPKAQPIRKLSPTAPSIHLQPRAPRSRSSESHAKYFSGTFSGGSALLAGGR